jgi:hypothetical protein
MSVMGHDLEAKELHRPFSDLLEARDALRTQLHQIKKQQAALAEKAARLRLQIALRDKSRFDSDDTDWS